MSDPKFTDYGAAAVFYDLDYRDRPDLDFWAEHIPGWGRRVLEVGCGTGRILRRLMDRHGSALILEGFDLSPEMIAIARKRTGLSTLQVGDMRTFAPMYSSVFDCVVIPFNSLMHLETPGEWLDTFRQCRRVMGEGGVLAFSLLNPSLEEWDHEGGWEEEKALTVARSGDGIRMPSAQDGPETLVRYRKWYRKEISQEGDNLVYLTFAFLPASDPAPRGDLPEEGLFRDGLPRISFRFPLRYGYPAEVIEMLGTCGFELKHLWGDWETMSPDEESETMIFVARAR